MPATAVKSNRAAATPRRPEQKYGPFHGGLAVCVWLNELTTENGPRFMRTLTISPRRFRDPKTGEWKDAGSLRATDIPALILGLRAGLDYMTGTPLPGQPIEEEPAEDTVPTGNGEVPF